MNCQSKNSVSVSSDSEFNGRIQRVNNTKYGVEGSPEERTRKISKTRKQKLILMVTKEGYKIKEAGRALKISYSTAKKIFTNFRVELRKKPSEESNNKTCHYSEVPEGFENHSKVHVVSSVAGDIQRDGREEGSSEQN